MVLARLRLQVRFSNACFRCWGYPPEFIFRISIGLHRVYLCEHTLKFKEYHLFITEDFAAKRALSWQNTTGCLKLVGSQIVARKPVDFRDPILRHIHVQTSSPGDDWKLCQELQILGRFHLSRISRWILGNFPFSHSKYISFVGTQKCKLAIDCSNGFQEPRSGGKLKYFNE